MARTCCRPRPTQAKILAGTGTRPDFSVPPAIWLKSRQASLRMGPPITAPAPRPMETPMNATASCLSSVGEFTGAFLPPWEPMSQAVP
jgi:hypothetical protein